MKKHHEVLRQLFKVLDSYRSLTPEFYKYLEEEINARYHPEDQFLFEHGKIIDKIYFLASGTMTASHYTEAGDKQLLFVYQAGDIIAGESFTSQTPCVYDLLICAGSYTLELTYAQLQKIYEHFPETGELAGLILSTRESKEIILKQMLILKGIEMVETFYNTYPELLEPGKVLRDSEVASYLLLAEGTLRGLRNQLFREGKLKHPKDKNY